MLVDANLHYKTAAVFAMQIRFCKSLHVQLNRAASGRN